MKHPLTSYELLPLRAWQEEELLLVAYAHHFDRGEDISAPSEFDWRPWAEAAGLSEREALVPLRGLAAGELVEYADPDGYRIRLRPAGVLNAETSAVAEPEFVARQKEIRRRILAALFWALHLDGPFGGPLPAPIDATWMPSDPGRTVEQLAAELRESAGDVLANCGVLYDLGLVTGAASGSKPIRITRYGLGALSDGQPRWPLH